VVRLLVALLIVVALVAPVGGGTPSGTALDSAAVTRMARDWLASRLAGQIDPASLEPHGTPRDLALPAGDVVFLLSLQSGSVESGTMTVLVEAAATDAQGVRASRSGTATFKIRTAEDVVVAVRELPRRAVLGPADVRLERRGGRAPSGAVRDVRHAVGKEVGRSFAPGEVLTAAHLSAPVVIRRGRQVSLVLEGPSFRIAARGVAAEDGAVGASIRVVNQSSRREIVGRVEDAHTVRVPF
jgi:flagella basal body P-ring formation protein FlgA